MRFCRADVINVNTNQARLRYLVVRGGPLSSSSALAALDATALASLLLLLASTLLPTTTAPTTTSSASTSCPTTLARAATDGLLRLFPELLLLLIRHDDLVQTQLKFRHGEQVLEGSWRCDDNFTEDVILHKRSALPAAIGRLIRRQKI